MKEINNEKNSLSDTDDFWSFDSLLPPKEKNINFNSENNISLVDFEIDGEILKNGEKIPPKEEQKKQTTQNTEYKSLQTENKSLDSSLNSLKKEHSGSESSVFKNEDSKSGVRFSITKDQGPSKFCPITEKQSQKQGKISFEKWLEYRKEFEKNKYTYGKKILLEYNPGGRFIKKVTISTETHQRISGERFINDSRRLINLKASFNGNIPFESFFPQYSQLDSKQTQCYIGFRTEVQSGRFPYVSRSYIYLYLYEIINSVSLDGQKKADLIASLICGYPQIDDKLFADMCNWLTDVCLIYRAEVPKIIFGSVFQRVIERSSMKEFFFDQSKTPENENLAFIMDACRYNYKKSKFYPEYSEYYDDLIPKAVSAEIEKLSKVDSRFSENEKDLCKITRESYFGAFCTSAVKRTITVEERSVTVDEAVKRTVSDMVKYAENCLRAELMIKPRLTVIYLPVAVRDGIKAFFNEHSHMLPKPGESNKVKKPIYTEIPEYEKLYEPKDKGISDKTADEIEQESWNLTERLITAFDQVTSEDEESKDTVQNNNFKLPVSSKDNIYLSYSDTESTKHMHVVPSSEKSNPHDTSANVENTFKTNPDKEKNKLNSGEEEKTFISALESLLSEDLSSFRFLAEKNGYFEEAFADMINEFFFDIFGDSVIESDGEKSTLIKDYIDDIKEIVEKYRKNNS